MFHEGPQQGSFAAPRQVIEAIAGLYREVGERALWGWKLYRDAAVSDPEVAADWQELHRLRRGRSAG